MAYSDKNIVIVPNTGSSSADPQITFTGGSAGGSGQITLKAYPTTGGTLSFEGSVGQLLAINNDLGAQDPTIFTVNDISGIPSLEVLATGLVKIAQFGGNVVLGSGTDAGAKFQVNGAAWAISFDRLTAGALTIGGTNATSLTLGKAGVTVGFPGGLTGNLSFDSSLSLTTASWAKWTFTTTGVTAKVRQGSDSNGLNFTSNALWTGAAWQNDDATVKSFAYIQHLGNGRHEFRSSPAGASPSWTTSLTLDETAAIFAVPIQSGTLTLTGLFTSNVASGSDAIKFSTSGARLHLGAGTNDYLASDGTQPTVPANFYVAGTLLTANIGATYVGNQSLLLRGGINDGASAIGVKIGNNNALSTSGAKIVSFYSDNISTEKSYIDKDGEHYTGSSKHWHAGNLTNLNQLTNGPGYYKSGDNPTFGGTIFPGADPNDYIRGGSAKGLDFTSFWTIDLFGYARAANPTQRASPGDAAVTLWGSWYAANTLPALAVRLPSGFTSNDFTRFDQWSSTDPNSGSATTVAKVTGAGAGLFNGGIDVMSAGALNIGVSTATSLVLGKSGVGVGVVNAPAAYQCLMVDGVNKAAGFGKTGSGSWLEISSNSTAGLVWANHYYNVSDKAATAGYSPRLALGLSDGTIKFDTSTSVSADANIALTTVLSLGPAQTANLKGTVADGASAVGVAVDNTITLANATSKLLSIRNNTTEKAYFDLNGRLFTTGALGFNSSTITIKGTAADGASALGVVLDTFPSFSTVGAKLVSIQNAGTEKAYIDKDGGIYAGGGMFMSAAATSATLMGSMADGSSAIGTIFDNSVTLANAAAKLLSIRNNASEELYVTKDGYLGAASSARTNQLTYSSDPSNAAWTKRTGYSAVANNATAPDGTTTAATCTFGSGGGAGWGFFQESAQTNGAFTFSIWLKAGSATDARVLLKDRNTDTTRGDSGILTLTSSWQRVVVSGTTAGASAGWRAEFGSQTSTSGTILMWNGKVEPGSTATPTIATTSAAVTVTDGLTLLSGTTDAATAVGTVIDTLNGFATAGDKLLSIRNVGVEKAYLDKDGQVFSGGNVYTGANSKYLSLSTYSANLTGQAADGASAVGIIFDNSVTLANATSKLMSMRNNGTEVAYVTYYGDFYNVPTAATSGTTLRNSAVDALQGAYWNGSSSVLYTIGCQCVVTAVTPTAKLSITFQGSELAQIWSDGSQGVLGSSSGANITTGFYKDASNNLVFKDAVTGAKTLAQLNPSSANITSGLGYTPTRSVTSTNSVISADTRNTNSLPQDVAAGLYVDFRANATDGLSDGGTYHGVLTFRQYGSGSDFSGGLSHMLAVTDNGNLYHRVSTGATTWGSWVKVAQEGTSPSFTTVTGTTSIVSPLHTATTATLTIKGTMADGASAVANVFDSPSYANSGAKLLSIRNNTAEKAYYDKDGNLFAPGHDYAGTLSLGTSSATAITLGKSSIITSVPGQLKLGGSYLNSLQVAMGAASWTNGCLITTAIPWAQSGTMSNLVITGYDYSNGKTIGLNLCFYLYNTSPTTVVNPGLTSFGSSRPTVVVGSIGGVACIYLTGFGGYTKLEVAAFDPSYATSAQMSGWTWADAAPSWAAGTNSTITYGDTASTSTLGYLSSTDWNTFNGKASANQTMYIGTTAVAINRGSGALVLTGITSIDGSSASCTGNAATATKLATARMINGVNFDGSAAITVYDANSLTFNNGGAGAASGSTFNGSAAVTISYNSIGAAPTANPTFTGNVLFNGAIDAGADREWQGLSLTDAFTLIWNNALAQDHFQFNAPGTYETTTDGTNWNSGSVPTGIFMGDVQGTFNVAYNSCQAFRFTWNGSTFGYRWYDLLYIAASNNGHVFTTALQSSADGTTWATEFTTASFGQWPGHLTHRKFISNAGKQWLRLVLTPTWNPTYSANSLSLYNIRLFGGYPTSAATKPFTWDYSRNLTLYGNITGVAHYASGTGGFDASSGIALNIGNTNATSVVLGKSGVNVGVGAAAAAGCPLDVTATGGMIRINGASGNNLIQAATTGNTVGCGLWAGGTPYVYSTGTLSFLTGATLTTASPTGGAVGLTISNTQVVAVTKLDATAGGAASDPYGPISVTAPADANDYTYYGLTRAANVGAGFGLTTGNAFWFGGSTTRGSPPCLRSGTAWLTLSSTIATFAGGIRASMSTGNNDGYTGTVRLASTGTDQWSILTFPDAMGSSGASNNYYMIGRGNALTDRRLSFHVPRASDYGSGNEPKFAFCSTGGVDLFTVEANTGNVWVKGLVNAIGGIQANGVGVGNPLAPIYTGGAAAVKTVRNVWGSGVYSYTAYSDANAPTTYAAGIGFGNGGGGSVEVIGSWTGSPAGLWYRSLRDVTDPWTSWTKLLDASNYGTYAITNLGVLNPVASGLDGLPGTFCAGSLGGYGGGTGDVPGWRTTGYPHVAVLSVMPSGNTSTADHGFQIAADHEYSSGLYFRKRQDDGEGGSQMGTWNRLWDASSFDPNNFITKAVTNLMLDAATGANCIYLNYSAGTGGVKFCNGSGGTVATMTSAGALSCNGDITANSDIRLKENIANISGALEKVCALRGVTFDRRDLPDRRGLGVIAQEVQKIVPEVVRAGEDGTLSVAYGNMVGLLIEAVKELTARVKVLEA